MTLWLDIKSVVNLKVCLGDKPKSFFLYIAKSRRGENETGESKDVSFHWFNN